MYIFHYIDIHILAMIKILLVLDVLQTIYMKVGCQVFVDGSNCYFHFLCQCCGCLAQIDQRTGGQGHHGPVGGPLQITEQAHDDLAPLK